MLIKLLLLVICVFVVKEIISGILYRATTYYKVTKNGRYAMQRDKGKNGEYLVWKTLRSLEETGARFLFNLYLPRQRGGTTEIDVLLLAPQGLFVIESKNYSGWIFGSEQSKYWTQTLPAGRHKSHKERFLNPILQNELHVQCLKRVIGENYPLQSVIVFSDHCELKRLEVNMSGAIQVVKRSYLKNIVTGLNWGAPLSIVTINELYEKLYPYTQVSDAVKEAHIAEIQERLRETSSEQAKKRAETRVIPPASALTTASATQIPQKTISATGPTMRSQESMKCPLCGGRLVQRTAKRGERAGKPFIGCSNYPKCRYTRGMQ